MTAVGPPRYLAATEHLGRFGAKRTRLVVRTVGFYLRSLKKSYKSTGIH
jgi:hypothetical protein